MLMPVLRLLLIYCLVALAVVAVFKRDTLMSIVFGEPETAEVVVVEESAAVAPAKETTEAAPVEEVEIAKPEEAAVPATPAPQVEDVVEAEPAPAPEASPEGNGYSDGLQMPVADASDAPAEAAPTAQPEATVPLAPEYPVAEAIAPAAAEPAPGDLGAARRAYWSGDPARAGELLAALAAESPNDPDVIGELGNFHYAQRQFPEAADAYLRAGKLLAAGGRIAQAQALVPVLQQIDPEKANALVRSLQGQ